MSLMSLAIRSLKLTDVAEAVTGPTAAIGVGGGGVGCGGGDAVCDVPGLALVAVVTTR